MRTLSADALASINAQETGEVWLPMVVLTHPDFVAPIRLVRNTVEITHNGDVFTPFPFDMALPDEEQEQNAVISWKALNATNELVEILRGVTGKVTGEIFWVLARNPDLVEIGPMTLEMRGFEYDAMNISGSMAIEPVLDAVFGSRAMDNTNAPGLF